MNGGFTFTSATGRASDAVPLVVVAGSVVKVLRVAAIGGGGPRGFCTGGVFCIGFFAFDETCFAGLLAAGVLVLVGGTVGAGAIAGTVCA